MKLCIIHDKFTISYRSGAFIKRKTGLWGPARALVTQTQGADLFAPRSVYWEISNAFSAMLKRQRITVEQAKTAVAIYHQIPLNLIEVDLVQAIEIASRLNIYAYDAYIITCAINQNCPLLSLDKGLIQAAKTIGLDIVEVE